MRPAGDGQPGWPTQPHERRDHVPVGAREPVIRRRVAVELIVLVLATAAFLMVFPRRPFFVDVGLALLAGTLLLLDARHTRDAIWGQFPCAVDERSRRRRTILLVGPVTGLIVLCFLGTGIALGTLEGGWATASQRIGNPRLLLVLAIYLPWALLQQILFQFYLLGRLCTLLPVPVAVTGTGVAYALVHLPDLRITLVTAIAGVFWSGVYFRYRSLAPLAFSHAVLGATYYYWVSGQDLAGQWMTRW